MLDGCWELLVLVLLLDALPAEWLVFVCFVLFAFCRLIYIIFISFYLFALFAVQFPCGISIKKICVVGFYISQCQCGFYFFKMGERGLVL